MTASVLFLNSRHAAISKPKVMSHFVNFKHENRVKLSRVFGETKSLCLVNYCKAD